MSTGRRRRWTDCCPGSDEPQRRCLRRGVDARRSPPTVRRAIASMPAKDRGCHRPVRRCCGIVRWNTPGRRVAITRSPFNLRPLATGLGGDHSLLRTSASRCLACSSSARSQSSRSAWWCRPSTSPFTRVPRLAAMGSSGASRRVQRPLTWGRSSSLNAGVHAGACALPGAVHAIDPVPDGLGRIGPRVWRPRIRLCTTADRIGAGLGRALRMRERSGVICDIRMADPNVRGDTTSWPGRGWSDRNRRYS